MGEKTTIERKRDREGTDENRNTETTGTTGTGGTGGTGGTEGTEGTGGTEEKSVEKVSGLSLLAQGEPLNVPILSEEDKKREERNAKRRAKYAEKKKESSGTTVRKRKSKKENDSSQFVQLNLFISTISSLVASRPGCEHWLLTEKEISSISEPLSKILEKNENLSQLTEHADSVALVMATITVFAPRIIITAQKRKEKDNGRNKTKQHEEKGTAEKAGGSNVRKSSSTNHVNEHDLSFLGNVVN